MKYNILWQWLQICIDDQLEWKNWSCVKAWALNFRVPEFSRIRTTPGFKFSQIRMTPGFKFSQIRRTLDFCNILAHHLSTASLMSRKALSSVFSKELWTPLRRGKWWTELYWDQCRLHLLGKLIDGITYWRDHIMMGPHFVWISYWWDHLLLDFFYL